MTVTVEPDEARGAGHATIRVPGAAGVGDAGFRISRDPDWPEPNLGPAGWQGAETVLQPDALERDGADLLLRVGPAVCDRLEEGIFFFALPAAGVSSTVVWPEIEAVHAGPGAAFAAAAPARPAAPAPAVPPPPPAPAAGAAPGTAREAAQEAAREAAWGAARAKRSLVPALLLGVVAAGAAAGAWWWFHREALAPRTETAPAPVAPPVTLPVTPPVPPPTPAADLDTMSVRDLVARGNNGEMVDQARKRLAGRPQDTLLLLETAGEDRHDGAALLMLAQLYDPNKPRQGGIGADARQAAKDYRDAERNGEHSGAADRDALHQSLLAARDRGDMQAKLIEGDFWP